MVAGWGTDRVFGHAEVGDVIVMPFAGKLGFLRYPAHEPGTQVFGYIDPDKGVDPLVHFPDQLEFI